MRRCLFRVSTALAAAAIVGSVQAADWKTDIGFTSLQARLGSATPTGAGIAVTQVEVKDSTTQGYFPNTSNSDFLGKTIIRASFGTGISGHATGVGLYYYGLSGSIAPAINTVDVYEVIDWLTGGFLNWTEFDEPYEEIRRVENDSWIGSLNLDSDDIAVLRRIDRVVERDGVVVAVGVDNGSQKPIPKLLASAYNVLAVGRTSGDSSHGPTLIDVPGRAKPDIVVPIDATSFATPIVASAAALLLQEADRLSVLATLDPAEQKVAKALLVKALLMGGATKAEFADWRKGFATPSTDGTVPLDYRYGAGELNIDNSDRILTAGQATANPTTDVATTGWDYGAASQSSSQTYFFQVPAFQHAAQLSILVTWNRHLDFNFDDDPIVITPSLANIDLRLYRAPGSPSGQLIDQSVSVMDNVEHIFLRDLPAGRCVFEVTSDVSWKYAVAWDVSLAPNVGVDFDGDGAVDQADLAYLAGCSSGPTVPFVRPDCMSADLDHDGDVDQADFGMFQPCYTAAGDQPDPACAN